MSSRFPTRSVVAGLTLLALATVVDAFVAPHADARQSRRGERDTFARYADGALRDSLMASFDTPGVVVLERNFVRFGKSGEHVSADVTYERVLFVREPEALEGFHEFSLSEYPGNDIDKIEAVRIVGDDHRKIDVKKVSVCECPLHKKLRNWVIDFGDIEAGDMLCIKAEYEISGANPRFTHAFDHTLPVVQSDVTFEVPRDLMEGREAGAFNWWAGSWPGGVAQDAWERPRSWRFRWGERAVHALRPGETPRVVASTWVFDPRLMGTAMESQELKAAGGSDIGYTGPTMSAQDLSGRWNETRDESQSRSRNTRATIARLGELTWEELPDRVLHLSLDRHLDESRGLRRILDKHVTRGASNDDVVGAVAAFVSTQIATAPLTLAHTWESVKRPTDVGNRKCASALDKAVLATALLRSRGIDAYPVLMKKDAFDTELVTVAAFDDVCVRIEGTQNVFLDVTTGEMSSRLPGTWRAVLFLDRERGKTGLVHGDELAALSS